MAILVSFPIGGYIEDLVVDGVDSVGAALAGGLIVGAIIGAAEWFALRQRSRGSGSRRRLWGWQWALSRERPWSITESTEPGSYRKDKKTGKKVKRRIDPNKRRYHEGDGTEAWGLKIPPAPHENALRTRAS